MIKLLSANNFLGEVKKNGKKMKEAKELKLAVVSEDFLTDVVDGDPKALVSKHNIVDWTDGKVKKKYVVIIFVTIT